MSVKLPLYTSVKVSGFQMYPGSPASPGIEHIFSPGLHLIAGVNGLGKSTLLLILYHGLVGPAAIKNDDFGVAMPEVAANKNVSRFRMRVADGAREATATVQFEIGTDSFLVTRSLHDLSLVSWELNSVVQARDEMTYTKSISTAMNVGSFSDVLVILNLIVFMFEDRGLLMWSPLAQRNALRALFMAPDDANDLAKKANTVAKANSAYRNLLYISNKDKKKLQKAKQQLTAADALSAEFQTLQRSLAAIDERINELKETRDDAEDALDAARETTERAKYHYDDNIRALEVSKLSRVANAFPKSEQSSQYVLARLIGDEECLTCGAEAGPLIDRWIERVGSGNCLICGSEPSEQETIIPTEVVDKARVEKLEERLTKARQALDEALEVERECEEARSAAQSGIDKAVKEQFPLQQRANEIAGFVPPSPPEIEALERKVASDDETLAGLQKEQKDAERDFSAVFSRFRSSVDAKADEIRRQFGEKISEFLVERAEISLGTRRGPIGESGQSYDWPTFSLSMTSGTFDAPAPRKSRTEVSMSQGEFIDLAFRLALVTVAADDGPASMIFDAPEASLDALFMRRAGAFLSRFTEANERNRLIVTSNLTNADMIPALFGAYEPQQGDPIPKPIPRDERASRVINLLEKAAPTSAVSLVGERYGDLLDKALFPPAGRDAEGL